MKFIKFGYDFNSPPDYEGLYRTLVEDENEEVYQPLEKGKKIIFGAEEMYAEGIIEDSYIIARVRKTRWLEENEAHETTYVLPT